MLLGRSAEANWLLSEHLCCRLVATGTSAPRFLTVADLGTVSLRQGSRRIIFPSNWLPADHLAVQVPTRGTSLWPIGCRCTMATGCLRNEQPEMSTDV